MNRQKSLVVVTLIMIAAACRDPRIPKDAKDTPLLSVDASQRGDDLTTLVRSSFVEPARLVVRDRDSWFAMNVFAPGPTPEVDFESYMIVIAAMGEHTGTLFSIDLTEAASTAETLFVVVEETSPGLDCPPPGPDACGVIHFTQPAIVARVARHDGEVQFLESAQTKSCAPPDDFGGK